MCLSRVHARHRSLILGFSPLVHVCLTEIKMRRCNRNSNKIFRCWALCFHVSCWLWRCQDFAAPCLRKCLCKCCAINFVSISLEQCFPAPGESLQPFPLAQNYHDTSLHSLTLSLAPISNEISSLEIHHHVPLLMKNSSISCIYSQVH